MRSVAFGFAILLLALGAGCGEGRVEQPPSAPTPTPSPVARLIVPARLTAHQGYSLEISGHSGLGGGFARARVSWEPGDGSPGAETYSGLEGRFSIQHLYARAGTYTLALSARFENAATASAIVTVEVKPRRVVFIQGLGSESDCPDGNRFLTRAPSWLTGYLSSGFTAEGLALDRSSFTYFSYSGRWCDGGSGANGAMAAYEPGETCSGVDERYGERLKKLIESMDGSRVTIVAHSMGGLLAAYVVASDPVWAQEHVASVATFDSPLGGINFARTTALTFGSWFGDICGGGSPSVQDMEEGSAVVRLARTAATVVPFYTLDGTEGDSPLKTQEAVPGASTRIAGERAHLRIDQDHADVWGKPGDPREGDKRRFVACALLLAGPSCLQ